MRRVRLQQRTVVPNLGDTHERGNFEVDVRTLLAERLALQGGSA